MKIFTPVFWAVILIVIGLVIIFNQAFGWNIKIFPIVFGLIIISIGISIIAGPSRKDSTNIFSGSTVTSIHTGDNNYIFSSATVSLDDTTYEKDIEVNSIFSSVKINTNGKSVKIKSSGAFSQTVFPDGSSLSFGDRIYERDGDNTVYIETNCVFGSIEIE